MLTAASRNGLRALRSGPPCTITPSSVEAAAAWGHRVALGTLAEPPSTWAQCLRSELPLRSPALLEGHGSSLVNSRLRDVVSSACLIAHSCRRPCRSSLSVTSSCAQSYAVRRQLAAPYAASCLYGRLSVREFSDDASTSAQRPAPLTDAAVTASAGPVSNESKRREPKGCAPGAAANSEDAGWSYDLINLPNALSVSRGLSGPIIALWIMQGDAHAALVGLAVAGATDWADGYFARQMKTSSVLGSYLDPLADKVLMGSVYIALASKGILPFWLGGLVIGRDVMLVGGSLYHRAGVMDWKWRGWREFFRMTPGDAGSAPSAPRVQPLLLSKANTVFQLFLVAGGLTHLGWEQPSSESLEVMVNVVAITTVATSGQYWVQYMRGRLFQ